MPDIDSLRIEITANAKKAQNQVDALVNSLRLLAQSVAGVDTGKMQGVANAISQIGAASANLKGASASGVRAIVTSLNRFSTVDTSSIRLTANALNEFNASLASVNAYNVTGLSDIVKGITKLGTQGAAAGTQNLIPVKDNLVQFVNGLNGIGSLSFDATQLTAVIDSITKLGGKYASQGTQNLPMVSAQLLNFVRQLNGIGTLNFDTTGLAELVASVSKLGGSTATRATTNIPKLTASLVTMMDTLSRAPQVSEGVTRLIQSVAELSAQGQKVGSAARGLNSTFATVSNSASRSARSTKTLAAAFGKFYATYFLAIRGAKSLMSSIEGTTDYIEAFNYQAVAFNKIAKEWGSQFARYGYDNADEYSKSFLKRTQETLGKLSGLKVDIEGGLLTESGAKNLGLNIQEITQYASSLASVTNSLGQTGEVSTAVSRSFTMLAGDISSLFNIDYQTVANNLQSGLLGQARALYSYGIDITNATLQQYAFTYGVSKSVSEMSQMEKQQLRILAILDQSKVSWGDLANTINSPSNMLRQFKTNLSETGMVIGQLFIPMLQKIMPVANGVVIAIKRMTVALASALGIKLDFDAFGQSSYDTSGLDDMADSYDKVAASAKKAANGIRSFDELNVINIGDNASGGNSGNGGNIDLEKAILDATNGYEKAWQDAFDKMENQASAIADKIYSALAPVRDIGKDFIVGDFFKAGQDVSALVIDINTYLANALRNVDWDGAGKKVGDFLAGVDWVGVFVSLGDLVGTAIDSAWQTYKGVFSAAPIETAIITGLAVAKFLGLPGAIAGAIEPKIAGVKVSKNVALALTITAAIAGFKIGNWLYDNIPSVKELSDKIGDWIFSDDDQGIIIAKTISVTLGSLAIALTPVAIASLVKSAGLMTGLESVGTVLGTKISLGASSLLASSATWMPIVAGAVTAVGSAIVGFNVGEKINEYLTGEDFTMSAREQFETFKSSLTDGSGWEGMKLWAKDISDTFSYMGNDFINWAKEIGESSKTMFDKLHGGWSVLIADAIKLREETGKTMQSSERDTGKMATSMSSSFGTISRNSNITKNSVSSLGSTKMNGLPDSASNAATLYAGYMNNVQTSSVLTKNQVEAVFNQSSMTSAMGGLSIAAGSVASGFATNLRDGINKALDAMGNITIDIGLGGGVKKLFSGIKKMVLPGYASGGYPSKYSLFMAGENGIPEIAGTVGGKTAVAGGAEITGIRDAVLSSSQEEIELLRRQVELLSSILEKDYGITTEQIGRAAQSYSNQYRKREGRSPY